jgi:chaperonin GroEL
VFDLLEAGVIDPVMVVRVAIENAVSLAIMLLTSKSVVTEDPKQKFDDQDARVV